VCRCVYIREFVLFVAGAYACAHPPMCAPAHVAEGAVVDVTALLVVKQVADVAVVARHLRSAVRAVRAHRLPRAALHAHHLADGVAVHAV